MAWFRSLICGAPLGLCLLASCSRTSEPVATAAAPQAQSAPSNLSQRLASDALAALSTASREAVQSAPLPVLLFSDPAAAAASTVLTGPAWYAISARVGERTLSLHVTREDAGEGAPEGHRERTRGAPAMVLFNEGVRSVTWSERGATYALEVECYRPFEDRACTDSAYVLGLAESLVRASDASQPSAAVGAQGTTGGAR